MAKGMHTHTHSQQNSKRKITYDPNLCKFEMLYHYTSLEKLALILRNRTIRLNPLDKMDDLQEQKTADVPNLGKFIYVSAWTSEKDESIFPVDNQLASCISTQFTTDLYCIFFPFGMSTCSFRTVAFYIPSSTSRVGKNMMFVLSHVLFLPFICESLIDGYEACSDCTNSALS